MGFDGVLSEFCFVLLIQGALGGGPVPERRGPNDMI